MYEDLEEIHLSNLDAFRLKELAKMSALTNTEFSGIAYGFKKGKIFHLKGIVHVYEMADDDEVEINRRKRYIRVLRKENPDYLFFMYHSHPDGYPRLSEGDMGVVSGMEIVLCSSPSYSRSFLRKKVSRVSRGIIRAYKIVEVKGKKKAKKVRMKVGNSNKL